MDTYNNWDLHCDSDRIFWAKINRPDSRVNTIDSTTLDEFNQILHAIEHLEEKAAGLVIYSDKPSGFIAGADINYFSALTNMEDLSHFLRQGHAVFARLESLTIPTVALIDGFCLGGGLELALACDYRIATATEKTVFGFPEINLGIIPGWGGTVRCTQLIGGYDALSRYILPGKPLSASESKALGLVDEVVPVRQLKRAGIAYIKTRPPKHQPRTLQRLSNAGWLRPLFANLLHYYTAKKAMKNHYPAPFMAIDLWEKEGGRGERAYLQEIETVEQLVTVNDTAKNLMRLFTLRERLKGQAKESAFRAEHVHIIGAGTMGGDIAIWCAFKGLKVTLEDLSLENLAKAFGRAYQFYRKKLKKPHLIQAAMDRLIPDPSGFGVRDADVIIEAAFEKLEVKHAILKKVEKIARKDALIATNTSSLPVETLNTVMKSRERLVGIHFFNPVTQMALVEVVRGEQTANEMIQQASAFVGQIDKLPLVVKSSPGFLVNRILISGFLECLEMCDEGIESQKIDAAAKKFGMVMGPLEMADQVGLDICLAVSTNLTSHFGGKVSPLLQKMVDQKQWGVKTGKGFYEYKKGKPVKIKTTPSALDDEIAMRLVLRMITESAACLREQVVSDADLLDAAMVFGTGFAPFRGGPMHYAKHCGKEKLKAELTKLQHQYGDRFNAKILNTSEDTP